MQERMMTKKIKTKTVPVGINLEQDTLERIDNARGDTNRSLYLRRLIVQHHHNNDDNDQKKNKNSRPAEPAREAAPPATAASKMASATTSPLPRPASQATAGDGGVSL